jgi:hypothetical protein
MLSVRSYKNHKNVTSKSVSSGSSGATKVMGPSNGGAGASLKRRWYPATHMNNKNTCKCTIHSIHIHKYITVKD